MKVKFHVSTDNQGSDIEEVIDLPDETTDEELEGMLQEFVIDHIDRFYQIIGH